MAARSPFVAERKVNVMAGQIRVEVTKVVATGAASSGEGSEIERVSRQVDGYSEPH